jgi:hypothetical protein
MLVLHSQRGSMTSDIQNRGVGVTDSEVDQLREKWYLLFSMVRRLRRMQTESQIGPSHVSGDGSIIVPYKVRLHFPN